MHQWGVYVFDWSILQEYLKLDSKNQNSKNDFGKNIIPQMLSDNCRMYAYSFDGYWKDVGTVESLWQANMDLLLDEPPLDLYDNEWRIYSGHSDHPPHCVLDAAKVENSLISGGCMVAGNLDHSLLLSPSKLTPNLLI